MKRLLIMLMVLGLIAGAASTAAASKDRSKRVERTVKGNYDAVPQAATGCNTGWGSFACVVVHPRLTEAFFSAKVSDAHGQPVFVQVVTQGGERVASFCGKTTHPLSFPAGATLEFLIEPSPYFFSHWGVEWVGPLNCPYRLKTSGSISVTLSNRH